MSLPLAGAGRIEALRRLEQVPLRAGSGHGGFVVVTGEAGIGKTHLLRALAASMSDEMTVAWGAGASWPGTAPFGIWTQILVALAPGERSMHPPQSEFAGAIASDPARWSDALSRLASPAGDDVEPAAGGELARLQLFDNVRALIRQAAHARPLLIVIDDLELVHPSALDLLSFVVPTLVTMPVAVVVAVRSAASGDDDADAGRLRNLLRQGEIVALSGLDAEATTELVKAMGPADLGHEASDAIRRRSGGNPLFALELLRLIALHRDDDATAILESGTVPETVMAVVGERVRSLSEDARVVLDIAAVLGLEFGGSELRSMVRVVAPATDIEAATGELVRESLVLTTGDVHRFAHGLLREAVHAAIPSAHRRRLHRAVVDAAGSRVGDVTSAITPAELADHLLASDAPQRVERAAAEFGAAARSEMAVHAYPEALRHADQAIALIGESGRMGAQLLVDRGTALLALGRIDDARSTFRVAADRARSADAPLVLARAALGMGTGETGFEVPLLDLDQIELLREALDRLPASETAWRARLLARLSIALTSTDEAARAELSAEAVDLARECGDAATIAAALAARCDVEAGPAHSETREAWASEVIELARSCTDPGLQLLGHRLRLVARLEQGDVVGALGDAEDFSVVAEPLGQPIIGWYPHLWRGMRLLLAGQSEAALAAVATAEREGARAGSINANLLVVTHRWVHWMQIGDLESMRGFMASVDDGEAMPRATWARVALALSFAHLGRLNAARLRLDAAARELGSAPLDSEWVPMLAQVAEAVSLCGYHPVADWTYGALLPHRNRHIVEGIGAVMYGSVEHSLGQLAAARGDLIAAREHFDAAVEANRHLGSPALVARTLCHAGVALSDIDRSVAARSLYDELGWDRCVARVDRDVGPLRDQPERPGPQTDQGRLVREADGWKVVFQDQTAQLPDSKGLHDLVVLLRRPNVEVAALELAAASEGRTRSVTGHGVDESPGGVEGDLGPLLDERARAAYRERILDLDAEIEEARSMVDPVRLERAEEEREAILSELSTAYGLGGAPRRVGDPAERARTTVTSRIRYAIDRIEGAHPPLGRHLRNAVVTGRYCCYRPENTIMWET